MGHRQLQDRMPKMVVPGVSHKVIDKSSLFPTNLNIPRSMLGVRLCFREVFEIKFWDAPQRAGESFIAERFRPRLSNLEIVSARAVCCMPGMLER